MLLQEYKKTEAGKAMIYRLQHLRVIGFLTFLYSILYYVIQYKHLKSIDYLISISLFLISLLFIMMSYKLQKRVLNRFARNKKKS